MTLKLILFILNLDYWVPFMTFNSLFKLFTAIYDFCVLQTELFKPCNSQPEFGLSGKAIAPVWISATVTSKS